jgi:NADPH:quinone reductase-like Zn-dependent oxidoreductase
MRAAILTEPDSTPIVGEYPDPIPGPGRSLVRVTAAPIAALDVLCGSGTSYFGRPATPNNPGVQGVGRIKLSGVLPAGQRVWFATSAGMAPGDGSLAELCSVADDDLVPVDAGIDDAVLAALGLSAVAAWMCLTWRAGLRPGERVVVLGGGGAVGQSAIGAAQALGASQVVAVCRSEPAAARARDAGASVVVPHVDDVAALAAALREAIAGPVDVVIDPVFGAAATAALQVLGVGGRLVNLGGSAGDTATFSSSALRSRSLSVLGYTNNSLSVAQRAEAITAVAALAGAGELRVAHVAQPLDLVADAWVATQTGRAAPRPVLVP